MLIFTICARNYLAYALTLRDSVIKHEPDTDFLIFLSDESVDEAEVRDFTVPMSELAVPDLELLCFRYSVLELSTAIKPFCFEYALNHLGYEAAIFLDPDTELYAPLSEVTAALTAGASCVVTPHILEPLPSDGKRPTNSDIVASGAFNLGFAAFSRDQEARAFLSWWGRELLQQCYVKLDEGLFVDQKFVDLAPSFLERISIIRHKGYNVAYWNLMHRPVEKTEAGWTAGGAPLVFFHFSGVGAVEPAVFSKHQDRFSMATMGAGSELVRNYVSKIQANGHRRWSKVNYAFDRFDDGLTIPLPVRRAARYSTEAADFRAYDAHFWNAPDPAIDQDNGNPISRLMAGYYALRPDLQAAFPLSNARGRAGFHDWFVAYGMQEYSLTAQQKPEANRTEGTRISKISRLAARLRLRMWR